MVKAEWRDWRDDVWIKRERDALFLYHCRKK
jgi:hypothetical protein